MKENELKMKLKKYIEYKKRNEYESKRKRIKDLLRFYIFEIQRYILFYNYFNLLLCISTF